MDLFIYRLHERNVALQKILIRIEGRVPVGFASFVWSGTRVSSLVGS
jgi:hypothetical protein